MLPALLPGCRSNFRNMIFHTKGAQSIDIFKFITKNLNCSRMKFKAILVNGVTIAAGLVII